MFQSNGGGTIVENTTIGIYRDIKFLREVAETTGVHVVAGTGALVFHNIGLIHWKQF